MANQKANSPYQCRLLNRELKVVDAIDLDCLSEQEAVAQSEEIFKARKAASGLAGFEVRQGTERLMARLENSYSDKTAAPAVPVTANKHHPHFGATYKIVNQADATFEVEVKIPGALPVSVAGFVSEARANEWIAKHETEIAAGTMAREKLHLWKKPA